MRLILVAAVVVLLCMAVVHVRATPPPPPPPAIVPHDSMTFALQWGKSLCNNRPANDPCKGPVIRDLTIHGLWPESHIQLLENCPWGTDYNEAALDFLVFGRPITMKDLQRDWPDVINGKDKRFWTRQWGKHGRCAFGWQPRRYFDRALALKSLYNPFSDLVSWGLGPASNVKRNVTQMADLFQKKHKASPKIVCNKGGPNGQHQLMEFHICVSSDTKQLISCSGGILKNCPANSDMINFPVP